MTKVVNIHEAKTHLSRLIEDVLAGESITIAKAGVPLIDLSIHQPSKFSFGCMKDQIWIQPGYDIDASDPEIVSSWDPELEIRS